MTDSTTTRRPLQLGIDTVITINPDSHDEDYGLPCRWVVTAVPVAFDAWVRVDYHADGRDKVAILPTYEDITVELGGEALISEGARVLFDLTHGEGAELPAMYRWELTREGLDGILRGGNNAEDAEREIALWADRLDKADISGRDTEHGYTHHTVTGLVDGVPVEVRASYPTPKPAEGGDAK